MKKHEVGHPSNYFWFIYLLGFVSGATGIFIFGTKKGREILGQIMDFAEDFEGNIEEVISNFDELKDAAKTQVSHVADEFQILPIQNSLHSVIEKIGSVLPQKAKNRRLVRRANSI